MGLFTVPGMPTRSSADSLSAEPSSSAGPSPIRPILTSNFQVQDALSRIREEDSRGGVWDADFASDITMAQIQSESFYFCVAILMIGQKEDAQGNEVSQNTLRATRNMPHNFPVTPAKAGTSSRNTSLVDDYSDMAFDEDEPELKAKMAGLKVGLPCCD